MTTNLLGWVSELARLHAPKLVAVARAEGLTSTDALDAVQEGFVGFLGLPQARSLAGEREDAEALMTVLVRNAARNMRRRHHRARPHEPITIEPRADQPGVDELIAHAERHVAVLGCINQLAVIQRQVVTLRVLEEVEPAEVARTLELTPGHVAVLLHRAKAALMECLSWTGS